MANQLHNILRFCWARLTSLVLMNAMGSRFCWYTKAWPISMDPTLDKSVTGVSTCIRHRHGHISEGIWEYTSFFQRGFFQASTSNGAAR